ncbi:MAG: NAD(P)/FAD-dependent oxidoreductase, partial [Acidimicrobiales bacterium]
TDVGAVYRDLHAEHGVELHLGVGVEALRGHRVVEEVALTDGSTLAADLVVVGVGVTPRTELAEAAGLVLDNGVAVDEHLCTSVAGVYAAGDVANAFHPFYDTRIRLEHWSAALNQGKAVARSMLRKPMSYDHIPYFYSDQYDLGMEYTGWAPSWARVVFRGDPGAREFVAFWLDEAGRVLAGMNANVWEVTEAIEALARSRRPVDVGRLTDPDVPLASLVPPDASEGLSVPH